MAKQNTQGLLSDRYKELEYFRWQLDTAETEFDFFRILAEGIVPLLSQGNVYKEPYDEWATRRQEYITLYREALDAYHQEVKNNFLQDFVK